MADRFDDSATQRIISGVEDVLEPFNAPDYIADYLKDDLQDAFTIRGPARPGYEPGRVAPTRVNLVDFVTDPLKTTWDTVRRPFETNFSNFVYTPDDFLSDIDKAVWEYLYTQEWKGVVPDSLQASVARWNERKGVRITRHLSARAVRENPGMHAMMSRRVSLHYSQLPEATYDAETLDKIETFSTISAKADEYESLLSDALETADRFKKAGQLGEANRYYNLADKIQRRSNRELKDSKKLTNSEFKRLSSKGGPLYDSSEARFIRYWEARNLRYATLNFLRTYKEDGFWGVAKFYGWKQVTSRFKDFYYASRINNLVNNVAAKLGIKKLLGKLADAQTFVKQLRAGFWLKKGMAKVGGWLIKKLGLAQLGALLGSALPGAGTALGAVIGAVIQFAGEIILEKLGGPLKIVGYVLAGVVGGFGLFAVGIVVLLSIVLGDHAYPWEAGGSAAPPVVQIEIKACEAQTGCSPSDYENPLRVSNGSHGIFWRAVVKNISSNEITDASISFSESQCASLNLQGDTLEPGKEKVLGPCQSQFTQTDAIVTNTVTFESLDFRARVEGVALVIFGNPPITYPTGWPLARGCITQGPDTSSSHAGTEALDIDSNNAGSAVLATFSGVVEEACWRSPDEGGCQPGGFGNYVYLRSADGAFLAIFAHLATVNVKTGNPVTIGQQLGTVGNVGKSTNYHLHYEFRGLKMAQPYIPEDQGIRGCVERGPCNLCW